MLNFHGSGSVRVNAGISVLPRDIESVAVLNDDALPEPGWLGALSAVGGFMGAWWFDLPVGACIVLFSSLVVGVALWSRR